MCGSDNMGSVMTALKLAGMHGMNLAQSLGHVSGDQEEMAVQPVQYHKKLKWLCATFAISRVTLKWLHRENVSVPGKVFPRFRVAP